MEVRSCWNQLFCRNDRPGAIYQSDSYDEFRRESGDVEGDLLAITETARNTIVGIVPLKATEIGLQFMLRSKLMYRLRPHGLMLLGSEPMLVEEPEAFDSLFLHLARHHPEASAISLMAVREGSFTWRYLATSAVIREHFYVYKPEGLRNCHAVEVPTSLDAYHRGLGKKRRYNLQRQERLLSEHLGDELTLVAIDRASRLHELYRAIEQLGATDDAILSPEHYALACKHGLLLCYVLRAGSRVVGLALGSQCRRTFLVHRLFHDSSLQRFLARHGPVAAHAARPHREWPLRPCRDGLRRPRLPSPHHQHHRAAGQDPVAPAHGREPPAHRSAPGILRRAGLDQPADAGDQAAQAGRVARRRQAGPVVT